MAATASADASLYWSAPVRLAVWHRWNNSSPDHLIRNRRKCYSLPENVVLEKLGSSVITYGELIYRARKSKHSSMALEQLHELVNLLPPLPLPEIAAESYGTIRAQLEGGGESIGNNELWIAAHALVAGLMLVTNNEREFRRADGLKVQNWVSGRLF